MNTSTKETIEFFREKYGINIQFDPFDSPIPGFEDTLSNIYFKIQESDRVSNRFIMKLQRLIKEHPDVPLLHNHLYTAYIKNRNDKLADKELDLINQKFPAYFFGKSALCNRLIQKGKLTEAEALLGPNYTIQEFIPKEIYHIAEVYSFYSQCCLLYIKKNELHNAKNYLRILWETGANIEQTEDMANLLFHASLARFKDVRHTVVHVEEPKKPNLLPALDTDLLDKLISIDESETDLDELLKIPHDELLPGLNNICQHFFYDYYTDELRAEDSIAVANAFVIFSILKYDKALPLFFDYISRESDFVDFWFEQDFDFVETIAFQFGLRHPDKLLDFIEKEQICDGARANIAGAMVQLALRDPELKITVIEKFSNILSVYLERLGTGEFIPTLFLTLFVGSFPDFGNPQLLEMSKPLFDHKLINISYTGDYQAHLERLESWELRYAIKQQPTDVYDFIQRTFFKRNEHRSCPEELQKEIAEYLNPSDPFELFYRNTALGIGYEDDHYSDSDDLEDFDDLYEDQPFKPDADRDQKKHLTSHVTDKFAKTKRNDPCPCGSGKKYKKCCF